MGRRIGGSAWAGRLRVLLGVAVAGVATASTAVGQAGVVQGRVVNGRTGEPLPSAQVRLLDQGLQARTDAEGRFRITSVPAGAHAVEAQLAGFRSAQRAAVVTPGAVAELEFALSSAELRAPQVDVIGPTAEALERIPGSAAVVGSAQLRTQLPLTASEVLRTVPGVHVQEEEGLGMRTNIGIRGLDPDRSRTVLVLEDGVPVALAPYGEPEMYYSPPIDRMARVEVVKGSGSILFGPQTVGGVINYVTPEPPAVPTATLEARGGTGSFVQVDARHGGTWGGVGTQFGLLRKQADDLAGRYFRITDLTGKAVLSLGGRSELGLKLGIYDEESNSTYVGLTEEMFAADPRQHPAPTDRLWIRRYSASATHDLLLGANAVVRTTVYGHTISRDWMRRDYNSADTARTAIVLANTTGNRNRSFDVAGIEPRLQVNYRVGRIANELDAGLRLHAEWATDAYLNGGTPTSRTGQIRDYEEREGRAISGFVQNRFALADGFHLTPGVRLESFRYARNILRTRVRRQDPNDPAREVRQPEDVDIRSDDRLFEVIPGIGATWSAAPRFTLFAGAHRGFAPPRTKDALIYDDQRLQPGEPVAELVSLQLDAERSWNFELGTRAAPSAALQLEATAFLMDFSNQIIAASMSGGAAAEIVTANQGETRHVGVESGLGLDLGYAAGLPFGLTAELKHTYVRATFAADRFLRAPNGELVNVRGNRLPYAPEHLLSGGLTLELPVGLRLRADGVYTGEQFADNFERGESRPDGRVGRIPAYTVWNLAGTYTLPRAGVELIGTVKNLLDETYIASRRPEGIMPGLPRALSVGARVAF